MQRKILFSYSTLAVVVPLFLCVILNALVRPWLADRIGGTLVRSGNAVRGNDRWWNFAETTRAEHPMLTGFLSWSDGAMAMITFAAIALLLVAGWLVGRIRAGRSAG
ncbi:hypothetical protein GRI97_09280 [Altererythrobacter xixiisoli]|uniref:Uncharacterized protein n=1 Tax=Croceibacterium xixiisoli TaxID=1476466 RepID=A0A6I4TVC0_9SPHN|nr:hypothetical protein [Croceibacterium xixiisoli]